MVKLKVNQKEKAKMTKKPNMLENYQVEEEKEKIVATLFSLRLVREKEVEYERAINEKVTDPSIVHKIAIDVLEMHLQATESFWIFTLDTKNKITGLFEVSRGTLNSSIVHPRDVFQRAILQNANSIMLMHNHPSGDPTPSGEDVAITKRLQDGGNLLGIKILDHVIVGDEHNYYSFIENDIL